MLTIYKNILNSCFLRLLKHSILFIKQFPFRLKYKNLIYLLFFSHILIRHILLSFACIRSSLARYFSTAMSPKDTLVVFDLDYTLWPFWVDTHVTPPFKKNGKGEIVDAHGQKIKHYPEVPKILNILHDEGYTLGIASRTSEIVGANQLVKLFNWDKYFTYKEIYPGCKVTHFNKFHKNSGLDFKNMIFFDDENRNIVDISKLGVTAIYVKNGMNLQVLRDGLEKHKNES